MRTLMMTLALFLSSAAMVHAQTQAAVDKAEADARSCMVMSDSMVTVLGLSDEQRKSVRKSDMRCLQACEKVGYRTTGNMDAKAMREHEAEMREILTTAQYATWSDMCITEQDAAEPGSSVPGMPSDR
jgi:hypothetical protein